MKFDHRLGFEQTTRKTRPAVEFRDMTATGGSATRGTYAKTEQFRIDVLDTALRILAERGFDATTLQLIADEVGRSKAGLLHHFGSRESLMLEIVRHRDTVNNRERPWMEDGIADLVPLVAHNATVPGLVALFAVVSALAAADPTSTPRHEYFAARYARAREDIAARLTALQSAGTIRDDIAPAHAATIILATMDGLQTQWLLDPKVDMAEHLSALISLLKPMAV
jgi:AcrR family transcriptional regulator